MFNIGGSNTRPDRNPRANSTRITAFVNLPIAGIDRASLTKRLEQIGKKAT